MHPLAIPSRNGANGMTAGDRVVHTLDGRHGTADEFLSDGDAFVTFDDGKFETVKWRNLRPENDPRVR